MPTISIPMSIPADNVRLQRLLHDIIEHDQLDDWLPDCVYFRDFAERDAALLAKTEAALRGGLLAAEDPVELGLPRSSGRFLSAIGLGLHERLCAHAAIAASAGALQNLLVRDKVFGFRYSDTRRPGFSPPVDGLAEALHAAMFASTADDCSNLQIWDVDEFSASARSVRLNDIFLAAGAPVPVSRFLLEVLGSPVGLPSCDDAFALVFNCYLHPVDSRLLESGVNFFRFRDEYFLLADTDRPSLQEALRANELTARLRVEMGSCSALSGPQNDFSDNDTPVLFENDDGQIVGHFAACLNDDGEPVSDCWELESVEVADNGAALEQHLASAGATSLVDALRLTPTLRVLHSTRRRTIQLLPPFGVGNRESQMLTSIVDPLGDRLQDALERAIELSNAWQAIWSATLLSDCASLSPTAADVLDQAAATTSLGPEARWTALCALARHGQGVQHSLWDETDRSSVSAQRRALLASSYLARHSEPVRWAEQRERAASSHSELVALLESW